MSASLCTSMGNVATMWDIVSWEWLCTCNCSCLCTKMPHHVLSPETWWPFQDTMQCTSPKEISSRACILPLYSLVFRPALFFSWAPANNPWNQATLWFYVLLPLMNWGNSHVGDPKGNNIPNMAMDFLACNAELRVESQVRKWNCTCNSRSSKEWRENQWEVDWECVGWFGYRVTFGSSWSCTPVLHLKKWSTMPNHCSIMFLGQECMMTSNDDIIVTAAWRRKSV